MKQGVVKFSKEFRTLSGNVWLGIENEYDMNTESPIDVFRRAEAVVQQYAKASGLVYECDLNALTPDLHVLPTITSQLEEPQIGVTPEVIMSCNDLHTIDSYRLIIKGKEELESAYAIRRKQIVAGEVKDILDRTEKLRGK
jgi:hypothetical protein